MANSKIAQGREIYVTRCAKCHAPEPVTRYARSEWTSILIDMAEETNLSPEETDAVTTYVMTVLDHPPTPPQAIR